jgi:hypothetical protein
MSTGAVDLDVHRRTLLQRKPLAEKTGDFLAAAIHLGEYLRRKGACFRIGSGAPSFSNSYVRLGLAKLIHVTFV